MALLQILAATLALWGFGGVMVDARIEPIPSGYPEGTYAYGWPYTVNDQWSESSPLGKCGLVVSPGWDSWDDETRFRTVAHEIGHCFGRGHDGPPDSVMTAGFQVTDYDWLALKAARPPLPHRAIAPSIAN